MVLRIFLIVIIIIYSSCEQKEEDKSLLFKPHDTSTFNSNLTLNSLQSETTQSSDLFEPDGYYYLKDTLNYKQFGLSTENFLDIGIMDFKYKHKTGKSRILPKDSVYIALNFYDTLSNKVIRVETKDFLIKKDTLNLNFYNKKIGYIKVVGYFTGTKGPYLDDVEIFETTVLKAKIIFQDTTFTTSFTWWQGD